MSKIIEEKFKKFTTETKLIVHNCAMKCMPSTGPSVDLKSHEWHGLLAHWKAQSREKCLSKDFVKRRFLDVFVENFKNSTDRPNDSPNSCLHQRQRIGDGLAHFWNAFCARDDPLAYCIRSHRDWQRERWWFGNLQAVKEWNWHAKCRKKWAEKLFYKNVFYFILLAEKIIKLLPYQLHVKLQQAQSIPLKIIFFLLNLKLPSMDACINENHRLNFVIFFC